MVEIFFGIAKPRSRIYLWKRPLIRPFRSPGQKFFSRCYLEIAPFTVKNVTTSHLFTEVKHREIIQRICHQQINRTLLIILIIWKLRILYQISDFQKEKISLISYRLGKSPIIQLEAVQRYFPTTVGKKWLKNEIAANCKRLVLSSEKKNIF